jgi:hypothetical protein
VLVVGFCFVKFIRPFVCHFVVPVITKKCNVESKAHCWAQHQILTRDTIPGFSTKWSFSVISLINEGRGLYFQGILLFSGTSWIERDNVFPLF